MSRVSTAKSVPIKIFHSWHRAQEKALNFCCILIKVNRGSNKSAKCEICRKQLAQVPHFSQAHICFCYSKRCLFPPYIVWNSPEGCQQSACEIANENPQSCNWCAISQSLHLSLTCQRKCNQTENTAFAFDLTISNFDFHYSFIRESIRRGGGINQHNIYRTERWYILIRPGQHIRTTSCAAIMA